MLSRVADALFWMSRYVELDHLPSVSWQDQLPPLTEIVSPRWVVEMEEDDSSQEQQQQ